MRSTDVILGATVLAAAASVLAGCVSSESGRPDKAGGSTAPLVLRLGAAYDRSQPDASHVRAFADRVSKLSHGKIRIDLVFGVGGEAAVDPEVQTVAGVHAGRFDLGWIGSRAWDEVGVTSFQALQAPFLITNYALLDRVVTSPLAARMLAGLGSRNLIGLALVPGLLRHPVGVGRPLVSVADYRGARVRDIPSRATDGLLRSLGATPIHVSNAAVVQAIARRRVDGEELSFGGLPTTGIVTANVSFFPKTLTLFVSRRAFDRLNERQRTVLRIAARETVSRSSSYPVRQALAFESTLTGQFCRARRPVGHVALASGRDIAGLEQATRPAMAALERDATTRELIAGIRRLAIGLPPSPPLIVPPACLAPASSPTLRGTSVPASALDGTYRWRLTESGAKAFGPPAYEPGNAYPEVHSVVLQDGTWRSPDGGGTYRVVGDRIEFDWPNQGYTLTFTFARDADGTLRFKPVLPMDRGDQWVWAGVPWRRVGPPS